MHSKKTEDLGSKIKAARAKLGLTQAQAAEKWGIPKGTLQNWEASHRIPRGLALVALQQILDAALGRKSGKSPGRKRK